MGKRIMAEICAFVINSEDGLSAASAIHGELIADP